MTEQTPRGYFERILAIDTETSGLFMGQDTPVKNEKGEYYQVVSWGLMVLDQASLEIIEELYIEQKWDGKSKWDVRAEAVHGLSKEYLEANGVSREEAQVQIASLILKYWGKTAVVTLGHNSIRFDLPFLEHEAQLAGIDLRFGNRHIDTNTLGCILFGTFNSDDLFEQLGFSKREEHNSLEDIRMTVKAARIARKMVGLV